MSQQDVPLKFGRRVSTNQVPWLLVLPPAKVRDVRQEVGHFIHLYILIHSSFACGGVRKSCGLGLRSYRAGGSYVWPPLARSQHLGPVQDTLTLDVHCHMVPAAGGTLAGSELKQLRVCI